MRRFVLSAVLVCLACLAPQLARCEGHDVAIFAGGCFWCVEHDFSKVPGVIDAESGYTGGTSAHPTYREVARQVTDHYEAVRITFDPARVSYRRLLTFFWVNVDPTDAGGQFCDRGDSYRSAIFAVDEAQFAAAEASRARARQVLGREIVTPVLPATTFWPAEAYHQDYARKNPLRYQFYRRSCGRDERLRQVWGTRPMVASDP